MSKRNRQKRQQPKPQPKEEAKEGKAEEPHPPPPLPVAAANGSASAPLRPAALAPEQHINERSWIDRVVAIAAVIGIFLAAWQGYETRQQNRISTESSQTELRAYIHPVTNDPRPQLSYSLKDGEFLFFLKMRNSGSTPAKKATARISTFFLPADDATGPAPESAEEVNGPKMTVGPSQEWTLGTTLPLESDERRLHESGEYLAWVVGKVEYEDVFGKKLFTTFRFQQGPAVASDDDEVSRFDMLIIGIESEPPAGDRARSKP